MIVYGDHARQASPAAELDELRQRTTAVQSLPAGLRRHAATVQLLIQSGELAQALIDLAFHERGCDDDGPLESACARLTQEAARAVVASWRGERPSLAGFLPAIEALQQHALPATVALKQPEGFAFYALYPELYAAATEPNEALVVIGLRSIGTSLAAIVAAAAGSRVPITTLRPVGHPFDRRVRLGPALERRLLADPGATYAIVDEGPGLSGSSFGAVADWLEAHGVARERLQFFPSHPGEPGPQASARHRERWRSARRRLRTFEDELLGPDGFALVAGAGSSEELSGGRWRAKQGRPESAWPPANTLQERRKFLIPTREGPVLARFVGLGRLGEAKLARAQRLAAEGFVPAPLGLRHGFLLERWLAEARPLDIERNVDRKSLLTHLERYLGYLRDHFPVTPGTSPDRLLEMAVQNTREALGEAAVEQVGRWRAQLPRLAEHWRPVAVDGRMHAWEWLVWRGRFLKADALDHHASHDCIGATDLGWDAAGAIVELRLDAAEQEALRTRLGLERAVVEFCRVAYLAFQLGSFAMAADAHRGLNPAEAERLEGARRWYTKRLAEVVGRGILP